MPLRFERCGAMAALQVHHEFVRRSRVRCSSRVAAPTTTDATDRFTAGIHLLLRGRLIEDVI